MLAFPFDELGDCNIDAKVPATLLPEATENEPIEDVLATEPRTLESTEAAWATLDAEVEPVDIRDCTDPMTEAACDAISLEEHPATMLVNCCSMSLLELCKTVLLFVEFTEAKLCKLLARLAIVDNLFAAGTFGSASAVLDAVTAAATSPADVNGSVQFPLGIIALIPVKLFRITRLVRLLPQLV